MTQTLNLRVTGMTCNGCENAVKRAVGQLPGVQAVQASHAGGTVDVTYDDQSVTREAIAEKIRRLGYGVED